MERKRTDERRTEGKKKKWAGLPFGGEFLFLTFLRLWPAPSSLVSALCASFALHSIIIIIIKDNNKAAATGRRLSHAIYFSPSSSSSSSSSSFLPLLVVLLPVSGFCCGNPEAATGGLHFPVWFDSFLTCLPFFLPFRFVLFAPPSFLRWLAAPFYLTSYFVPFRRGVRSVSLFASSAFFFPPPAPSLVRRNYFRIHFISRTSFQVLLFFRHWLPLSVTAVPLPINKMICSFVLLWIVTSGNIPRRFLWNYFHCSAYPDQPVKDTGSKRTAERRWKVSVLWLNLLKSFYPGRLNLGKWNNNRLMTMNAAFGNFDWSSRFFFQMKERRTLVMRQHAEEPRIKSKRWWIEAPKQIIE